MPLRHHRPRRALRVVAAAIAALLAAGCSSGRPLPEVDVDAAAAGATAPPADAVLVEGEWPRVAAFVADSAARDQATVVNIFASWCAPCERELPLLLDRSRRTDGVRWLGVASEDLPRHAEPFVQRLGVHWPTVLDRTATTHVALESLAMPTTAFFDADGRLRSVVVGEMDAEQLDAELARVGVTVAAATDDRAAR